MTLIKWKLMITTLPFVAASVGLRLFLDKGLHFTGVVEFTEVGMVLTGGVFLIGVMLAGTMTDYKESERLPAEVAGTLEMIEEIFRLAAVGRPALDPNAMGRAVLNASQAILDGILGKVTQEQVFAQLEALNEPIHALERAGAGVLAGRALGELGALRKSVSRINVISRTSFLQSGYALLESVVVTAILLVQLSRFHSQIAAYTLVTFVSLIFVYMLRLIKDVDDPFEYTPDGTRGAAEVELFPITEYRDRASRRLAQGLTERSRPGASDRLAG